MLRSGRTVGERPGGKAQAIAADGNGFAVGTAYDHFAGLGVDDYGRKHVARVRDVAQRLLYGVIQQIGVLRQFHKIFRPAVGAFGVVVQNALANRAVGGILIFGGNGGVHIEAAGIAFCAVLGIDQLAHHLPYVAGMHGLINGHSLDDQRCGLGCLGLLASDEAVFNHAVQNVELPDTCPFGIDNRVVERRRLGQSGQHGGFGQIHVFDGFAKIRFCGSGKAVSTVAQKNLAHIDIQNLVFAQRVLHFEGQQHLVNLALDGLFRRQIHIARHLHGDSGRALAFGLAEVGQARA